MSIPYNPLVFSAVISLNLVKVIQLVVVQAKSSHFSSDFKDKKGNQGGSGTPWEGLGHKLEQL